jgi:hypothetical protein
LFGVSSVGFELDRALYKAGEWQRAERLARDDEINPSSWRKAHSLISLASARAAEVPEETARLVREARELVSEAGRQYEDEYEAKDFEERTLADIAQTLAAAQLWDEAEETVQTCGWRKASVLAELVRTLIDRQLWGRAERVLRGIDHSALGFSDLIALAETVSTIDVTSAATGNGLPGSAAVKPEGPRQPPNASRSCWPA